MGNGTRNLGLCVPISVIQGRYQMALGKKKEKEKKINIALCFHLYSLPPYNKYQSTKNINQTSINTDGTTARTKLNILGM